MFKTQDTSQKQGVNFYVGAATDIANPTGDVAQGDKTDNSVFANKSVINNGYSFYEYDMDILPESITPNVDKK